MPEWWLREMDSTLSGVMLGITAVVLSVMGLVMVTHATSRGKLTGLTFWFGLFMVIDGLFYAMVTYRVLQSPAGARLWFILLSVTLGASALQAFRSWAREKPQQ